MVSHATGLSLNPQNAKSYASFLLNGTHNQGLDQAFASIEATYRGLDAEHRDQFTAAVWPVVADTGQAPHVAARVHALAYAGPQASSAAAAARRVTLEVCDQSVPRQTLEDLLSTACFEMASMAGSHALPQMQAIALLLARGHGSPSIHKSPNFQQFLICCAQITRPDGILLRCNFFGLPEAYQQNYVLQAIAMAQEAIAPCACLSVFAQYVAKRLQSYGKVARCLSINAKAVQAMSSDGRQ